MNRSKQKHGIEMVSLRRLCELKRQDAKKRDNINKRSVESQSTGARVTDQRLVDLLLAFISRYSRSGVLRGRQGGFHKGARRLLRRHHTGQVALRPQAARVHARRQRELTTPSGIIWSVRVPKRPCIQKKRRMRTNWDEQWDNTDLDLFW